MTKINKNNDETAKETAIGYCVAAILDVVFVLRGFSSSSFGIPSSSRWRCKMRHRFFFATSTPIAWTGSSVPAGNPGT
jgi:hypothetical protein